MRVSSGGLALSLARLSAPTWSFSGFNLVHVKGRGFLAMEFITVGDEVLVQDGTFSRIYSFGQRNPLKLAEYRQIDTDYMDAPLEITPERMVFVHNGSNMSLPLLLPASQVKIGDYLVTEPEKSPAKVLLIRTIRRYGQYSPLTVSGDIVASGVAVSNFMTLRLPFDTTYNGQHAIQQAASASFRLYCRWKGDCHNETYDRIFYQLCNTRLFNQCGLGSVVRRLGRLVFLAVALMCTIAVIIVHHFSARKCVVQNGHARTKLMVETEEVALNTRIDTEQQPSREVWNEHNPDTCISELVIEQAQTDSVEIVHAKIETEVTTPRHRNQRPHTTLAQ
jgi:Hint module